MTLGALARARLGSAARLMAGVSPSSGVAFIHELRVALRRAQPFLTLARPNAPERTRRAWLRDARRAERLFSPVRNCDVVAGLVKGRASSDADSARQFGWHQRKLRERRLAEALSGFGKRDRAAWVRHTKSLLGQLTVMDSADFSVRADAYKRRRLLAAAKASAELSAQSRPEAWHELRKELRLFRYALEDEAMLGRVPDTSERAWVVLQQRLGDANDLAVLQRRIEKRRAKLLPGSPLEVGYARLERETDKKRLGLLADALPAIRKLAG